MRSRIWLALAIVVLVAASFAASSIAAKRSSEGRPKYVTRGLDYLHSRQMDDGGFATPENTAWAILGAIASGERMGHSAWFVKGKNPFDYLQSTDLVAAGAGVDNAPVYYSRLIMAYVAMGKGGTIGTAGSKGVNLIKLLLGYQDTTDGSVTKGAIAPSLPSTEYAVRTTSWALLAMSSAKVSLVDPSFQLAETWLAAQQNDMDGGDGGFASSALGGSSDALDTALAMQALSVSSNGLDWASALALQFLHAHQNADGGFAADQVGSTNAEATSAAIQAILAAGGEPEGPDWQTASGSTPITALDGLLQRDGSYERTASQTMGPIAVTSWALVARNKRSFATYPLTVPRAVAAFKFRPLFRSISPRNGTKFKNTRSVLIHATYTDFYPKGTGIDPAACRVYVDNANRSRPARIGRYKLRLQLKGVKNGSHTYTIKLIDHAGNEKIVERTFSVDVVITPVPEPTTQPTYIPNPVYPTYTPKPSHTTTPKPVDTITPTPYQTVTPYPYNSVTPSPSGSGTPVSGSPVPSPSTSASPGATGGGGGSAAGFVGGTLLAMLPIGAAISFLALQRREDLLGGASQGTELSGGGSSWERFKNTLAKSKDLTKPSSRK